MGLLARAEEYLQHEAEMRIAAEQRAAEEQIALAAAIKARPSKIEMMKNTASKIANGTKVAKSKLTHVATDFQAKFQTVIKKAYQPQLRRLAATVFALGLSLQTVQPTMMNNHNMTLQQWTKLNIRPAVEQTVEPRSAQPDFGKFVEIFGQQLHQHQSRFSKQDRDDLARLLYGEAGIELLDNIEVLHIILNRYASPLFKGTLRELLTAEKQFIGFKSNHPVLPELRLIVDEVVNDFEANDCKEICDHFYFVTHQQGICNKYEISPKGSHGKWVNTAAKVYEAPHQGCMHAMHQTTEISKKLSQIPTQRVRINGNARSL